MTAWTEALYLASLLPSVVLLLASALAVRLRSAWGSLTVVILWTLWVSLIAFNGPTDPTGIYQLAVQEGCIGSPALFIAVVAAISVGMILYTAPRNKET